MMRFDKWADSKTRKLTVWDIALVKSSCIAGGMLLSRLWPASRRIDNRLLAVIAVGLAVKPAVTVLLEKTPTR